MEEGDDVLIDLGGGAEVEVVQLDEEDGEGRLAAEEIQVGLLDMGQVAGADIGLEGAATALDIGQEGFYGAVQVDEQVGFGKMGVEDMKEALEEAVFLFREVVFGKKKGFDKKVVGHDALLEEVGLFELVLQLFVAFGHEEQLHGKRVALGVIVKKGQKGVVGELL